MLLALTSTRTGNETCRGVDVETNQTRKERVIAVKVTTLPELVGSE